METKINRFTLILIFTPLLFCSLAACQENSDGKNPEIIIIENYDKISSFAEILSMKEFADKVIYIDIWVAPCSPCIAEFKHLPELKNRYKNKDVVFLYLARSYGLFRMSKWEKEMQKYNLEGYHIWMTEELKDKIISELPGIARGYPRFILINKKGKVAYLNAPKPSSREKLYKLIDELLEEKIVTVNSSNASLKNIKI
jgi:thiol-disulfide isomerase/thioredoxin